MPNFELLGSLAKNLHQEFVRIYYLMLPVAFALSIAMAWIKSPQGSFEFVEILKRAFVTTLLLAAFPEISRAIIFVADGIAERVDAVNSLDAIMKMAQQKAEGYSLSTTSVLLQFNDLIIATLSFMSFLILYVARYLTIAMYHFFWIFFLISAPLLMVFNLFAGTSQVTVNLFKGMIEVASWKIVWAILGAMLTALAFGDAYQSEGNYLVLIVMNFVIAIAMLATPLVVRSIAGSGFQSMSSTLGPAAVAGIMTAPGRIAMAKTMGKEVVGNTAGYVKHQAQRLVTPVVNQFSRASDQKANNSTSSQNQINKKDS